MSSKHQEDATFLERYLDGEVPAEDIDDYVDRWHAKPGNQQIFEFLGLSRDEYAVRMRDPNALPHIARARREHQPLGSVIASTVKKAPKAAGSPDAVKAKRFRRPLAQRGKVN